jgi:aminopeptidase N
MFIKKISILLIMWYLLPANTTFAYTHADSLRGGNGRGRAWWNVVHYDLQVTFDTADKSISGTNLINFSIEHTPTDSMQIDLQAPMVLDSVVLQGVLGNTQQTTLTIINEGNVWWAKYPFHNLPGTRYSIMVYYHGSPREAVRPPWDGGFSWKHDNNGKLWVSVSCQGLGASVWWPCKDAQWDEPDNGMVTRFSIPGYYAIGNGKAMNVSPSATQPTGLSGWEVKNPINSYDATFYIGDFVHWHDTLIGEKGTLDLDYWVLRDNKEKARKQFAVVKKMIHCYEYWLGPYPFYEDGYKLVEAPYLGMEHQSAIAYGNEYKMGYLGIDRSLTGVGTAFDYIIVHESGHEWFGNSITAKDVADNWIHEGITTFSESLFAECLLGKEKAKRYCIGSWHNINNERPVIGHYGVNEEGGGDIYEKGAAIMQMIRQMTNDDEKFRQTLRGLSKDFYHQTVTTGQVEDYIALHTGLELKSFFNQYLRTTDIPQIEYGVKDKQLSYRFNDVVAGFSIPLTVSTGKISAVIKPTAEWQHIPWSGGFNVQFSKDYLIKVKE